MADKYVSVSFDDGWKSAITNAEPLLAKYRMPATFYIISERPEDTYRWSEYMDANDLRTLAARGHEIGVHTRSHKHLPDLSDEEARSEIFQGLKDLQALGFRPRTFAYPFGEWNRSVVEHVREAGFFAARGIEPGENDAMTNRLLLKARPIRECDTTERATSLIANFTRTETRWLVLYLHQIESADVLRRREWIYGTTPEVLEGTLSFIRQCHLPVVSVEEGMERIARRLAA